MIVDILGMSLEDLVKEPSKEKDPIIAFIDEADSKKAKDGLKKAKKIMDLILFHRDLNRKHQDIFNGK